MFDLISIGEPLVQLNPLDEGPIRHVSLFEKHVAGSETNIVIGLSRLGLRTALVSKIGKDELSKSIYSTLKAEGVDVSWVQQIDKKNCGIFFVQRNYPVPGRSDVIYFRGDAAARLLSPEDLPIQAIKSSRSLHVSGITPALSESCRSACRSAIEIAKKNKVTVSFDTNYRKKLWSPEEARPVLKEMSEKADILFLDPDDASLIQGRRLADSGEIFRVFKNLGPETIVLKLGAAKGLIARTRDGEEVTSTPARVPVHDSIGAGDAVVVGFMGGYLLKETLQKSLDMASACSALVVMRRGDYENLPDREYLEIWLKAREKNFDFDPR